MNKDIVVFVLCMFSLVLGASQNRDKRSVFGVKKHQPLSPGEVQYYLKELSEIQDKLTRGDKKGKKHRKSSSWSSSSGRGGKKSSRKSWSEEPPWRAGMHWWEKKHGKKRDSSSSSWSSSSYRCDQPLEYGNTDCTDHTVRYYFERESKMCRKFHYTGCGGNKNNFHSKHECVRKCKH